MTIEKLKPNFSLEQERVEILKQLVPEAIADGKINWDVLKEAVGEHLEEEGYEVEHFGLNWSGKRQARRLASMPSKGALVAVPGEGINEETTGNIFIEGDNLEVLKLLQKSYAGRIKMIYIDPPYNTGNDFIYKDDYSEPLEDYLRKTNQIDEEGNLLTSNPKSGGRFHSNWLNMIYPRLRLARNFLREDGVIFISIDDNEVHNLRLVLGELFGEENFIATLVWQKSKKGDSKLIAKTHEYILIFAKNKQSLLEQGIWRRKKEGVDEVLAYYQELRKALKDNHEAISIAMRNWYTSLPKDDPRRAHKHYQWSDKRGLYFAADFAGPDDGRKSRPRYDIIHPITGKPCKKPSTGWRWDEDRTKRALLEDPPRIHFGANETTIPCRKSYLFEIDSEPFISVFYRDGRAATLELEHLVGKGLLEFPKNTDVLKELIKLATNSDDIIMDFFAGSGTTAQAVLELNKEDNTNRRFIIVQLPEPLIRLEFSSITDITKKRIRQVLKGILEEQEGKIQFQGNNKFNQGFKIFSLTKSNFKNWENYTGNGIEALQTLLFNFENPLINGWKEADVVTEIQLVEGFPLDSKVGQASEFTENRVLKVSSEFVDHRLFVCLEDKLKPETIDQVGSLASEDIFICLDTALTDEAKLQLTDSCNIKTI
jgi:adenine-specific DNA-methyltransferase